jgi:AcrR family transcriptional regulator
MTKKEASTRSKKASPKATSAKGASTKRGPASQRGAPVSKRVRYDVEERRAQLIALGIQRFARQPYDDVSIDEIAEAAGISKGLLYHYFPTKRAFYVATLTESSQDLLKRTEPDPSLPPLERAIAGLTRYIDYVDEHAASFSALMRGGIGSDREVARIVDSTREAFVTRILENAVTAIGLEGPALERLRAVLRGWIGCTEAFSLDYLERKVLSRDEVRNALVKLLISHIDVFRQLQTEAGLTS